MLCPALSWPLEAVSADSESLPGPPFPRVCGTELAFQASALSTAPAHDRVPSAQTAEGWRVLWEPETLLQHIHWV